MSRHFGLLGAIAALFAGGVSGSVSHSGKHRNQRSAVGRVGQGRGKAAQRRRQQREAGNPRAYLFSMGSQAVHRAHREAFRRGQAARVRGRPPRPAGRCRMTALQIGIDWSTPTPTTTGRAAVERYAHPPAVRSGDPDTSFAAAAAIATTRTDKQRAVLAAFARYGAMTAKECERLNEFETWAPSTVRKRCSELQRMGFLVLTGQRRNGCREYARSDTGAR